MCMYMQNTLTYMQRLPLISVAFIEGKAMGGGAELSTACDFRFDKTWRYSFNCANHRFIGKTSFQSLSIITAWHSTWLMFLGIAYYENFPSLIVVEMFCACCQVTRYVSVKFYA